MTTIANFTASNGTNLASYTPDAGGSFTEHSSFSSGDFAIQSNRAYPGSNESVFYHSATIARSVAITAPVRVVSTGAGYAGVWAGVTGSNSCYVVYLYAPTGQWACGKYVSGSWTSLGTYNDSVSAGTDRTVQLVITSSQVIFKVDGTTRGTFSDTAVTPTRAGVYGGGSSSTTGVHVDSFSVTNVPTATGTVYSSGTNVGVACGCDAYSVVTLAYDHPNGSDEVSLLKVERSSDNSTWADVTSSVTTTALGSNDWKIVDPRPQYGSQAVSYGGTAYYRVSPGNEAGYYSASSATSLVADVDKASVRAASYVITSTYAAGHGGYVPSAAGASNFMSGEVLLTFALAYWETGTAQYLTDATAQYNYIVGRLDANNILHWPDYTTKTYRDHHNRTATHLAIASRILNYAGATTLSNSCLTTANAMAKAWLDNVNSGSPTTSHTTSGWYANNQTAWASATSYSAGAIVRPTSTNSRTYRAMNAGTSGGSQPTWPTSTGGTVSDNGITWKETSYTGQCSSQTYAATSPYATDSLYVTDPNQNATEAALFALLYTDSRSDFYAAGTYRTKALTAITDAVGLICACQASDGAITLGEAWTASDPGAKDTLYGGFTLAQLAIVRHLVGDVLPELPLFLSRGLNWLETRSGGSTEPITAVRYTADTVPGFSELYARAVGARVLGSTSAVDKLPYSAAFIDTQGSGVGEYGAYSSTGNVTSFGSGYQSIWDLEAYITGILSVDAALRGSSTATGRAASDARVDAANRGSATAVGRNASDLSVTTDTATRGSAVAYGRTASEGLGGVTDTATRGYATARGRSAIDRVGATPTFIATPTSVSSLQYGGSTVVSAQHGNSVVVPADSHPVS